VRFRHLTRGGTYFRVADPEWPDPLDGRPSMGRGARWNAPGSFPVVYLNSTVELSRRFVAHKLRGQPYGPEDLDPGAAPTLVFTTVPTAAHVDVVTDRGCRAAGLPVTYPRTTGSEVVPHGVCQPIGQRAWEGGEPGIACRSATAGATPRDEELAWFQRRRRLRPSATVAFTDWFWG
jgi:RES domain